MTKDILNIPKTRVEALVILGLQGDTSKEEIKKAYQKYALKWHPDKWSNESEEEQKKATENFKAVNIAYKILTGEISEEFISKQTNDDWVDEWVNLLRNKENELWKKEFGLHLSQKEIDLFKALVQKDLKKIKILLETVKNVNVQCKPYDEVFSRAPLHYIVENACKNPKQGWEELLEEMLSKYDSNRSTAECASNATAYSKSNIININIQGHSIGSPLHIACELGSISVVHILLNHEANTNVVALENTPLYYALKDNRDDIAELLFEHGAKIGADCAEARKIIKNTLQYSHDTVKILLPHISDRQKSTMLQFLSYSEEETDDHVKIAELLLKAGADPKFSGQIEKGEMPNSSSVWAGIRKKAKLQELFSQYKTSSNTTRQPTTRTAPQQKQTISGASQTSASNATPLQQPPVMNSNHQPTIITPPQQRQPINDDQQTVTGSAAPFEEILIDNETNNNLESEKQDNEQPITTHNSKQEHFLGISTRGWIIISTCAIVGALALYFLAPLILGALGCAVSVGAELGLGAAGALTGGVIGGGIACLTKIVISQCCGEEEAVHPA